ncbi:MAG: SDR family NAD(P)-dependent oxidoreductase [Negativicutes bacterium]
MKLRGKFAIITGGAAGIGFATAKTFLQEGASVAICDVNGERVAQAVADLSALGIIKGYAADIAKKDQVEGMINAVLAEFGRIDILVNNAGITQDAQFYKMTEEQFDRVVNVNLKGTFLMTKSVVNLMIEQKYGKIVHLSSVSAFNGNFGQTNYAATKAAIMGMTRVMGKELGKFGINVNAVAPGSIMTDMYSAVPDEVKQKKLATIPLRRYGTPEEAANLIAFLSSDESSYITAQTIVIDGGFN